MKGMHSYFHVVWMGNHNRYFFVFSRPSSPHIIAERQNLLIMIRLYFSSWWHNALKPGVVLACKKHYQAHSRWPFGPPPPRSGGYDIQLCPSVHTYVRPVGVNAMSREPVDLFLLIFTTNVYLGASGPPVDFGELEVIFKVTGQLRRFCLCKRCLRNISRTSRPILLIFSTNMYMRQETQSRSWQLLVCIKILLPITLHWLSLMTFPSLIDCHVLDGIF